MPQSALLPAGVGAGEIAQIWYVLLIGSIVIFIVVMALTAYVLVGRGERARPVGGRTLIIGAGFLFPIFSLSLLLLYVLPIGARLTGTVPAGTLRIEVVGKMWWWEVRYRDHRGRPGFVSANEVRLPVGEPVEVMLKSEDVIHSFWVPSLAGKTDMIPGRVNRLVLQATEPGTFRGQCAEYCGAQHAWMAFDVEVMPEAAFAAWWQAQVEPVAEPAVPFLQRGRDVFVASGCGACHRVQGLPGAKGDLGPDLTHVGSRATIAAGLLPTSVGSLAGWIANPHVLKPGAKMPAFDQLPGEDLRALAAWLASLE